jgi:hypothetical protein
MRMFTSPLRYVSKMRARRRQVRTVLHMLSASGVIRLGHIEPRYFEQSSHVDALYRQEAKRVKIPSMPVTSVAQQSSGGFEWTKLRQFVLTVKPSRLQIEQ